MQKPSGMTVVTAGLGALVLFGVVWSRDAKRAEPWPRQSLATPGAALLDIGTTFQLHSGAWRAWPAPVEAELPLTEPAAFAAQEAPTGADVSPPTPEAPAGIPAQTPSPAVRSVSVPIQKITRHVDPPAPSPQALPDAQISEPSTPAADEPPAAPNPPPPEGRMALSGPDVEVVRPAAGHAGHSAPRAQERAPEPDAAPSSNAPKFGPAIFKQVEQNGF
jgi:hypothetical protein